MSLGVFPVEVGTGAVPNRHGTFCRELIRAYAGLHNKIKPEFHFLGEAELRCEIGRIADRFHLLPGARSPRGGERKGRIRQDGGRKPESIFLVLRNIITEKTICYHNSLVSSLIFSQFLVQKNLTTYSLCGLFSPSDKPNLILPFARLRTGFFFALLLRRAYYPIVAGSLE